MRKQRYTTEASIHELREADVMIDQDHSVAEAPKKLGITDKTDFP